ncbi:MAG TPA: uroporphyrinogen-III synthase [Stellaceae bacterium]|jgi:uroporphyrinogen-III synthase|nr:uroporphyrinogen-III synthase [Stellaceae bacterium]
MSDQRAIGPLSGRRIALPETRELDRLARMFEEQGAETLRCPLVAIRDTPDPAPVRDWLMRLPFDDLVLFTGEGLRRLHGFAQRFELEPVFLDGLRAARKITRGPKPERALRELGLKSDLRAEEPTTDGLIATLSSIDLRGRRVGVQLYPGNPNTRFTDFLRQAGAKPEPILPYVYATAADDEKVAGLIDRMADRAVDAIAFTSSPQVQRLFEVAAATRREETLHTALQGVQIGAVGPVVAEELRRRGVEVTITPDHGYFMKPLVSAFLAAFSR